MFGKLGDMAGLMKMAMDMKNKSKQIQEEMARKTFQASAGGGAVTVTLSGRNELLAVKISPDAVNPNDIESLEEFIKAAVNEGSRQVAEAMKAQMAELTGGMGLPDGLL